MESGKFKILIIDDDQTWQNRLQRMLVHWGYQVSVVRSIKEAEEVLIQEESFDLITVDMNLTEAGGEGWDLVEIFTETSRKPGIVIVSGVDFSPLEIRDLLRNYGHAVDFVPKSPFDRERFKSIVEALLKQFVEVEPDDEDYSGVAENLKSIIGQGGTAAVFKATALQANWSANIRRAPGLTLTAAETELLARAFPDSREIFVEREIRSGYSGTVVLLVSPGTGQAQVVVKLGSPVDLRREYAAYRQFVKHASPQNTARLQGEPLLTDDEQLALLSYTFAGGDPRLSTHSLQAYYESKGGQASAAVLDRFFRIYGRQWWTINRPQKFVLSEQYDRLLPVHLKLKLATISKTEPRTLLAGQISAVSLRDLQPGQPIRLQGFQVAEIRPDRHEVTLTTDPPPGEASAPLRLRLETDDTTPYQPGERLETLDGIVTATRQTLLAEAARSALPAFDPEATHLSLHGRTYPNPLLHLSELLDRVVEARVSTIHGDLNLENILVDSETGFAWLIDFADTRQGPALFDLQRLEAQVITKLLAPAASQAGLEPAIMVKVYQALHADPPDPTAPHSALQAPYTLLVTIRRLARQFLMNDIEWDEYYWGLILTLLGALKFTELGTMTRALVFAGAVAAQGLLNVSLPPSASALPEQKPLPALRWPVIGILIALFLLILSVVVSWLLWWRPTTLADEPLALIASIEGPVEIRRHADNRVQPAIFNMDLFEEDAVLAYEEAAANILCRNGLLLRVGPEQIMVVRCQDTGDEQTLGRLNPQLSTRLIQASESITITLAPADTRASRADIGQAPTLIGPRNTAIIELQPTWRWEDVAGGNGYRLAVVNAVTGEHWQAETTATELTYPADAPSLVPNTTYLTRLELIEMGGRADESFFFLLDEANRNDVTTATEAIRMLSLDPATEGFLLAGVYREEGLWDAAITQLEAIPTAEERPELMRQLGDLYFQVRLYPHAERSYQVALATAQLADNPVAQAEALVGLGRVADAYGETEMAIKHFQTAETLYRRAGDMIQAEAVAQILAELAAHPATTTPHPSPTP